MARLQAIAILVGAAAVLVSGIQVQSGMRSFSSAIKAGTIGALKEKVLYEYESQGLPGVITEQWFTGKRMHSHILFHVTWPRVYIFVYSWCYLDPHDMVTVYVNWCSGMKRLVLITTLLAYEQHFCAKGYTISCVCGCVWVCVWVCVGVCVGVCGCVLCVSPKNVHLHNY